MTEHGSRGHTSHNGGGYMWVVLSIAFAVVVVGGALAWVRLHPVPNPAATVATAARTGAAATPRSSAESSTAGAGVVERSDRVEALQREMTKAGVYSGALDGVYGPATQASLKKLQAQVGVPATGLFDQATWKAAAAKGLLKASQTVMSLQLALKTLGYYDGDINGRYDVATELAVSAFQRESGLRADGVWSPTLDAVIEQSLDSQH